MWISRKEFDELKRRIGELEEAHKKQTVYKFYDEVQEMIGQTNIWWHVPIPRTIPYKRVVEMILGHLGLRLDYEPASTEKYTLVKEKKK